ncbi:MAG: hypothetical protein EP330_06100 [Deltaproteobacteria bacterium]|nr:MAG: hypothetical protein EP330_06100 [Deltaproteobacteria bacterium]
MAELDDITRLGALDEAIRAEERAVERANQRLADEEAAVKRAEGVVSDLESQQRASRAAERALEAKLSQYGKQLQAALRSLETGIGNPEVAESQRQKTLALIDDAETEVLENIEHQEHLAAQHQVASTEAEEARAQRDAMSEKVGAELTERNGRLDQLRSERVPAVEALTGDLLGRYDALRAKKGSAVTTVDDQRCCTKCRMLAAAQQLSDIRKGRLETCRGCGRWITV